MTTFGFIGTGHLGSMLVHKFIETRAIKAENIIASNRTREKAEHLAKDLGIRVGNNREAVGRSEVIFLCVRSLEIKAALKELSGLLKPEKLLVSAAVDFSLKDLEACHRQAFRGRRSAF
jgi:pyrroline-5-carboxylate reductase